MNETLVPAADPDGEEVWERLPMLRLSVSESEEKDDVDGDETENVFWCRRHAGINSATRWDTHNECVHSWCHKERNERVAPYA